MMMKKSLNYAGPIVTTWPLTLLAMLVLMALPKTVRAQLSPGVKAYRNICLDARSAILAEDFSGMEACMQRYDEFADYWEVLDLSLQAATAGQTELNFDGHIVFNASYLDRLLSRGGVGSAPPSDESRGAAQNDNEYVITVAYRVIPARGKRSYNLTTSCGDMELVVLAERAEAIGMSVVSDGLARTVVAGPEEGLLTSTWSLPEEPNVITTITIENPGREDISVIIISN